MSTLDGLSAEQFERIYTQLGPRKMGNAMRMIEWEESMRYRMDKREDKRSGTGWCNCDGGDPPHRCEICERHEEVINRYYRILRKTGWTP